MKRVHFIQGMLALTGTAFIYGCKEVIDGVEESNVGPYDSPTIEGAKKWFTDSYVGSLTNARTQKTSVDRKLNWNNSQKIKKGKHDYIWVPVEYEGDQLGAGLLMWREGEDYVQRLAKYLSWSITEGFIAYRKPNGDYDGFLAQMAFDPTMTDITNPKMLETFSGLVINADMNENILRSWRFLEGRMVSYSTPQKGKSKEKEKEKGARTDCYTYYTQYTTVTGQSCGPNCTEVFYTVHSVPHDVDCGGTYTGSDPGYMGSGAYNTGDWYGYNVGTPTIVTAQIKNQLQWPCFKTVMNNLLSASFNNKVQQILLNFNKSSTLNFTIKEEWMGNTTTNGQTVGNVITLNLTALNNASQEFVAKVIYHEVLHIYLGTSAAASHQTMATQYVAPMAQALMAWFSISLADATNLAWSGLSSTPAYQALTQTERYNIYITHEKYRNLNNAYNHQYGHPCP